LESVAETKDDIFVVCDAIVRGIRATATFTPQLQRFKYTTPSSGFGPDKLDPFMGYYADFVVHNTLQSKTDPTKYDPAHYEVEYTKIAYLHDGNVQITTLDNPVKATITLPDTIWRRELTPDPDTNHGLSPVEKIYQVDGRQEKFTDKTKNGINADMNDLIDGQLPKWLMLVNNTIAPGTI
jgi:hypothetical protein